MPDEDLIKITDVKGDSYYIRASDIVFINIPGDFDPEANPCKVGLVVPLGYVGINTSVEQARFALDAVRTKEELTRMREEKP